MHHRKVFTPLQFSFPNKRSPPTPTPTPQPGVKNLDQGMSHCSSNTNFKKVNSQIRAEKEELSDSGRVGHWVLTSCRPQTSRRYFGQLLVLRCVDLHSLALFPVLLTLRFITVIRSLFGWPVCCRNHYCHDYLVVAVSGTDVKSISEEITVLYVRQSGVYDIRFFWSLERSEFCVTIPPPPSLTSPPPSALM